MNEIRKVEFIHKINDWYIKQKDFYKKQNKKS
nr:MAG TPA: hypothetical protein [Caudoviricetes sp.]